MPRCLNGPKRSVELLFEPKELQEFQAKVDTLLEESKRLQTTAEKAQRAMLSSRTAGLSMVPENPDMQKLANDEYRCLIAELQGFQVNQGALAVGQAVAEFQEYLGMFGTRLSKVPVVNEDTMQESTRNKVTIRNIPAHYTRTDAIKKRNVASQTAALPTVPNNGNKLEKKPAQCVRCSKNVFPKADKGATKAAAKPIAGSEVRVARMVMENSKKLLKSSKKQSLSHLAELAVAPVVTPKSKKDVVTVTVKHRKPKLVSESRNWKGEQHELVFAYMESAEAAINLVRHYQRNPPAQLAAYNVVWEIAGTNAWSRLYA
ncbi:unnamed protein product, partial [Mesorhabditis spiculigera]